MSDRPLAVVGLLVVFGMVAPAWQGQPASALTELWHLAGRARGTPAIDDEAAYYLTRNHAVVAVERASGQVRWEAPTGEPGESTMGSRVVATESTVVAGDYNVIGFDRHSGALRWRFQPSAGYGAGIYIGATHNDTVFTGSPAGRLYAIHANSGALRWSAAVFVDRTSTVFEPITDGTLLVAGYTLFDPPVDGGVVAVDPANGKQLWRTPFPSSNNPLRPTNWAGGLALVDQLVIASSGDGGIHAFDRKTGAVRWSLESLEGPFTGIIRTTHRDYRPLVVEDGMLVAGSLTGYIVAYDLATRKELWRHAGGQIGSTAFQFAHDSRAVYAPYLSGTIVALELTTGRELWRVGDFTVGFIWPPAVDDNTIFAGASHGGFYSFVRP